MLRIVATRGATAALRTNSRAFVAVPVRYASSSNNNQWDSMKKDASKAASSGWEAAKQEGKEVLESIKQGGKDWAKDIRNVPEGNVGGHPYLAKGSEAASEVKQKASEAAGWAEKKGEGQLHGKNSYQK